MESPSADAAAWSTPLEDWLFQLGGSTTEGPPLRSPLSTQNAPDLLPAAARTSMGPSYLRDHLPSHRDAPSETDVADSLCAT